MTYQIGDKLWVTSAYKRKKSAEDEGYECMVTKVGRKWIYFTGRWTDDGTALGRVERFHMGTGEIDGGAYCSPGHVWLSREAYLQSQMRLKAWKDFQRLVDKRHYLPDPDFLYALKKQLDIMKAATPIL